MLQFHPFLSLLVQAFDEKNIRRRVYDALNVLMAMEIISRDKKEIRWNGMPSTTLEELAALKVWMQRACTCACCMFPAASQRSRLD